MNDISIRQMESSELKETLALVKTVFLAFEAPEYSEEGINEFFQFIDLDNFEAMLHNNEIDILVAVKDERIIGMIAIKPTCHISLMFVSEEYHRQGVARALFNKAKMRFADRPEGTDVNSSPYAVEIYKRLGFSATDSEQTVNGIRFTPMRYVFN